MAYSTNSVVNLGHLKKEATRTAVELSRLAGIMAGAIEDESADKTLAVTLLINRLRQHIWTNEDEAYVCEEGTVTLTNTQKYPFNNSIRSVALAKRQKNTKYTVIAEVTSSTGNAGEVEVTEKQVNGFKLAYTGSATSAVIHYTVIGGYIR